MNGADILMRVIQRLNSNPYNLTKQECISEVSAMRDAALAAPHPSQGAEVPKFSKWWKDKGQFISLPPGEPEDFALERAIAKAAWNAGREVGQNDTVAAPHQPASAEAGKGVEDSVAYRYACTLAQSIFDSEYASDPDYASGRVKWGLCDSTAGVLTQIDNMVSGMTRKRPSESVAVSGEVSEDVIEALGHRKAWRYKYSSDPHHSSTYTFNRTCLIDFARAVLALAGSGGKA